MIAKAIVTIGIIFLITSLTLSQQDRSLDGLLKVEVLQEVIGVNHYLPNATLSTSGKQIAWLGQNEICISALTDPEVNCYVGDWTPESYITSHFDLNNGDFSWSSDDDYLVYAHNERYSGFDSDIGVLDIAENTYKNLTPDEVFYTMDADIPVSIDYLPTWNTISNDLYFFRTLRTDPPFYDGLLLYQISPLTDELILLTDLSDEFYWSVDGAAVSPDGQTIAMVLWDQDYADARWRRIEHSERVGETDGIWLFDIASRSMTHLATSAELMTGMPEWIETRAVAPHSSTIQWTRDGQGLVVAGFGAMYDDAYRVNIFHYIDVNSGVTTPLTDLEAVVFPEADEGNSMLYNMPIVGLLYADSNAFYYAKYASDQQLELFGITLPPTNPYKSLGFIDVFQLPRENLISVKPNGKAVINNILLISFDQDQTNLSQIAP